MLYKVMIYDKYSRMSGEARDVEFANNPVLCKDFDDGYNLIISSEPHRAFYRSMLQARGDEEFFDTELEIV